jgi:hypothetical protein
MLPPAAKNWIITVSGERPIHVVADDLVGAGFEVRSVLPFVGSIVVSGTENLVERLRSISGVSDIAPEYPIEIGPPGAPLS